MQDDPTEVAEKTRRQLILDYRACFAGTKGERVLADLKARFGFDKPTTGPGVTMEEVYRREAMKHPIYHILLMTSQPPRPKERPRQAITPP